MRDGIACAIIVTDRRLRSKPVFVAALLALQATGPLVGPAAVSGPAPTAGPAPLVGPVPLVGRAPLVGPVPPAFDLHALAPAKCGGGGDEIVVCGSAAANETYRLRPLPDKHAAKPLRAETKIFGDATGGIGTGQEAFGNGTVSKRVMVTIKVPF